MLVLSMSSLHATEYGLRYNWVTQRITEQPYTSGLHFVPFSSFIRFPNTYQNLQFSNGDHDLLHTRTSDGLPLTLGLSFQYTLDVDGLYPMYMAFKDQYHNVLFDVATDVLATQASKHSAYEFFNNKQAIANVCQRTLNEICKNYLYLTVETLQILLVRLPEEFEGAIVRSIEVKQNIPRTQKTLESASVRFPTRIMAAHQSANQTITVAQGNFEQIKATQEGNAIATLQTTRAEASAYRNLKAKLGFSNEQLLDYIYWDSMSSSGAGGDDSAADSQFVVGLDPTPTLGDAFRSRLP
jgi:regulator of protease activity HflC (stomatin/prohibitin superfamily)